MQRLYVEHGLTTADIAERLGSRSSAVVNLMRQYGISPRSTRHRRTPGTPSA